MTTEQRVKVNNLKDKIKEQKIKVEELLLNLDVQAESQLSEEEQKVNKEKFKDTLAIHRANIKGTEEELKLAKMNKLGSTFFEFIPNPNMNRRAARRFRTLKAQGKLKK